ncbi:hypothetical protein L1887_50636 [Cichorium endivia]|nr:hypothetical protein L1887_50636 [Cichorium endivia]
MAALWTIDAGKRPSSCPTMVALNLTAPTRPEQSRTCPMKRKTWLCVAPGVSDFGFRAEDYGSRRPVEQSGFAFAVLVRIVPGLAELAQHWLAKPEQAWQLKAEVFSDEAKPVQSLLCDPPKHNKLCFMLFEPESEAGAGRDLAKRLGSSGLGIEVRFLTAEDGRLTAQAPICFQGLGVANCTGRGAAEESIHGNGLCTARRRRVQMRFDRVSIPPRRASSMQSSSAARSSQQTATKPLGAWTGATSSHFFHGFASHILWHRLLIDEQARGAIPIHSQSMAAAAEQGDSGKERRRSAGGAQEERRRARLGTAQSACCMQLVRQHTSRCLTSPAENLC